jgi:hypothetical protein
MTTSGNRFGGFSEYFLTPMRISASGIEDILCAVAPVAERRRNEVSAFHQGAMAWRLAISAFEARRTYRRYYCIAKVPHRCRGTICPPLSDSRAHERKPQAEMSMQTFEHPESSDPKEQRFQKNLKFSANSFCLGAIKRDSIEAHEIEGFGINSPGPSEPDRVTTHCPIDSVLAGQSLVENNTPIDMKPRRFHGSTTEQGPAQNDSRLGPRRLSTFMRLRIKE